MQAYANGVQSIISVIASTPAEIENRTKTFAKFNLHMCYGNPL